MSNHTYIEYTVRVADEQGAEVAVAFLSDFGFESFTDYLPDEMGVWGVIKGYIPASSEDSVRVEVEGWLAEAGYGYERTEIEQQNWNAVWESAFEPIEIQRDGPNGQTTRCYIHAPFHPTHPAHPAQEAEYPILITPKMSFGTGHHATTALMVRQMLGLDFAAATVLDMGSGTAILAVLAARLGAVVVDAVDVDQWAYENGVENVAMNGVQSVVCPILGDVGAIAGKRYDIILANINRNILLSDMARYVAALCDGGLLLVSGILETDIEAIRAHAQGLGLNVLNSSLQEGWAQITFRKG